jgi:hypothetical protein
MKRLMLGFAAAGCLVTALNVTAVNAQQTDPQPTCKMCPGTYLPATEIQEYIKKALAEKRTDQQARDDIARSRAEAAKTEEGKRAIEQVAKRVPAVAIDQEAGFAAAEAVAQLFLLGLEIGAVALLARQHAEQN